jgi:hypothetical protein
MYKNDQTISTDNSVQHFIYADDSAIAIQENQFEVIEKTHQNTENNE